MEGPVPKFSGRNIFTDHNYEGDAFLKGLGNANVSPFKDVVEGVQSGVQLGSQIVGLIREVGPEGQERRRLDLEKQRLGLKTQEAQMTQEQIKAREAAATSHTRVAEENANSLANTAKAKVAAKSAEDFARVINDIDQMGGDPRSISEYLRKANFGTAVANPNFSEAMGTYVGSAMIGADNATKRELIDAMRGVSPKTANDLLKTMPTEVQAQFQSPAEQALTSARNRSNREGPTGKQTQAQIDRARWLQDKFATLDQAAGDSGTVIINPDGTVDVKDQFNQKTNVLTLGTGTSQEAQDRDLMLKEAIRYRAQNGSFPELGAPVVRQSEAIKANNQPMRTKGSVAENRPAAFSGARTSEVLRDSSTKVKLGVRDLRTSVGGDANDPSFDSQWLSISNIARMAAADPKKRSLTPTDRLKLSEEISTILKEYKATPREFQDITKRIIQQAEAIFNQEKTRRKNMGNNKQLASEKVTLKNLERLPQRYVDPTKADKFSVK